MFNELPFAKNLSYWKTSQSDPDKWLDKTEKIINEIGGEVHTRFFGTFNKVSVCIFGFNIGNDNFRMTWPILPVDTDKEKAAARRQTATLIYHDTKAKINSVKIFGPRIGFANYLITEGGKTVSEIVSQQDFSIKLLQ